MKKLALLTLMIACVAFVFVSCAGGGAGGVDIVINENDPTVVKDGSTLAPNTMVKFAWTDPNGNPVTCDVILEKDGVKVEEFEGVTEVLTGIREEGHYKAYIIPVNASGSRAAKIIRFTVNKMYEELYKADSGLYFFEDLSSLFLSSLIDGGQINMLFSKMGRETVENTNPEETNIRVRLALQDTNENGVPDSWKEVETYAEQKEGPLVAELVLTPFGTAVYKTIQYTDENIKVIDYIMVDSYNPANNGLILPWRYAYSEPQIIAEVGLDIGVQYTHFLYDENYTLLDYGSNILISERYDSKTKPEFSVIEDIDEISNRTFDVSVNIAADNVARFADIYETDYLQVAVSYPASLTLDTVTFSNFFDGQKEFTSYKILDDIYDGQKIVLLYRGLVFGNDENGEISRNFATLHFNAPEESGIGLVSMATDGSYLYEYGPMFKNNQNANVDGFVINYDPILIQW